MPPVPKPKKKTTAADNSKRNLVIAIAAAAVLAAALIGGSVLTRGGSSGGTSSADALALVKGIPQSGTLLGSPSAKVRMLQFEDLQCPICKQYTDDAFPAIVREYVKTGRVRLDFRGLSFLGPDSEKGLRIAIAAGIQANKLWDVVGLLYAEQGTENSGWLTDAKVDEILAQVPGLDAAKVKALANSEAVTKEAAAVRQQAKTLAVAGTPSFAVSIAGGKPYPIQVASYTPETFRPILDDALKG
jgi:protein-disulfide isomerase